MATDRPEKTVLVLGAYGFIGAAVVRSLHTDGACVKGLVRSQKTAERVLPDIALISGDLRDFKSAAD